MNRKKPLGKDERVGLKLSMEERKVILGSLVHIHQGLSEPIRATARGAPILLSVDELSDLGCYVAAEANHAKDKMLRKKLDAISSKIQDLLETHSGEESPKSLNFENGQKQKVIADQTVELGEWAAKMLIGAEQLGIKDKPVARFPLAWAERAVLLLFTSADKKSLTKLEAEKPSVTVAEVGGLLMVVATALFDAAPLQSNALFTIAKSLKSCLEEEIAGALKPIRGSES